jgi:hypothetical protein
MRKKIEKGSDQEGRRETDGRKGDGDDKSARMVRVRAVSEGADLHCFSFLLSRDKNQRCRAWILRAALYVMLSV